MITLKKTTKELAVYYSGTQEILQGDIFHLNESEAKYSLYKHYDNDPRNSKRWFGVEGGSTALFDYVEHGWREGVIKIERLMHAIKVPNMTHLRPRITRGDHGDEFDIHAAYAGEFDRLWTRMQRMPTRPDTRYCIAVDICGNASEDSDSLFWPGAAAYATAKGLIAAGKPVRIVVYMQTRKSYSRNPDTHTPPEMFFAAWDLKGYQQTLSPDKIALAALSGYFRSVGFKLLYMQPYQITSGMGQAQHPSKEELRDYLRLKNNEILMYLGGVRSRDKAQNAVNKFLADNFDMEPEGKS